MPEIRSTMAWLAASLRLLALFEHIVEVKANSQYNT